MTRQQYDLAIVAVEGAGLSWQRVGATSARGWRLHVPELGRTYRTYHTLLADLRRRSVGRAERTALLARLARRAGPPRPEPADGFTMMDL